MQSPLLSIIVCTYNREKYIGECLTRLAEQDIDPTKYEVLVINNKSTDNTQEIIKEIIPRHPKINFHYFIEENQGHTYARNRGIKESKGTILSFLDDDAFVQNNYCKEIIDFFNANQNVSAIGGRIIPKYENATPSWMSKYLLPLVAAIDLGKHTKPFKGNKFPIGANMAFRRSMFEKYGLFDVNLGRRGSELEGGDEKEMFIRLRKGGEIISYVPEVAVEHIIPGSRIEKSYIMGLAKGVGTSERKRLNKEGLNGMVSKVISEIIKSIATLILSLKYALSGQFPKAKMLILFRYWVVSSLLKREP